MKKLIKRPAAETAGGLKPFPSSSDDKNSPFPAEKRVARVAVG